MAGVDIFTQIKFALANILFVTWVKFKEMFRYGFFFWWWMLYIIAEALYFIDTCYQVAKRDTKAITQYSFLNFGYGEAMTSTINKMLTPLKPWEYSRFIDLGSGRGLTAFNVHFLFGIDIRGVEILKTHVQRSKLIARLLGVKGAEFINDDILNADLSEKAIYYLATTSFEPHLVEALREKLKETPVDSIIIMVHHKLPELHFELFHHDRYAFTWGYDSVYFYRRTVA